jgi:hypothetical protein
LIKNGFKIFGDEEYMPLDVENKRVVGLHLGR